MEVNKTFSMKNIGDILGLTSIQAGMLFYYLKAPGSANYIGQLSLDIVGDISLEIFKKAWDVVIETNEMLRVIFRWEKLENPIQMILKSHELQPVYYDLSRNEAEDKKIHLEKIKTRDRESKFDLQEVPFRVILCKIEEDKYEMIIINHHILYDGWSNGIILKEFFRAYHELYHCGRAIKLPVKPPFKEFIKWIQSQDRNKQSLYWREYLAGFETPTVLPIKRRIEETRIEVTAKTEDHSIVLEEDLRDKLDVFVKNNRVTLASVFYAAWGILLQRYCDSEDIIFGTTVSGRSARIKGIEDMVGLFINTIPLRVQSTPGVRMIDIVSGVEQALQEREEFESTPLQDIRSYSKVDGTESLFDTIMTIENYPLDSRLLPEDSLLSVNSYSIAEMPHYDLSVGIMLFDEIEIKFSYNRGFFDKETVENLARHLKRILQSLVDDSAEEVSLLEIISIEEKNRILYEFNNTAAEYPTEKTIHRLFEEQLGRTPDRIAVFGRGRTPTDTDNNSPMAVTYRELNKQSNRLARLLIDKGVLADNIVGIMVERSIEMLIGIFGVLQSGAAYLPIDPNYPKERTDFMLKDSGAKILVTRRILEEKESSPASPLPYFPASDSSSLAYVIYTSGSTGKPKGVMIANRSVINFIKGITDVIPFQESDRILSLTTISFDIFGLETILPLTKGSAVIIGSAEEQQDAGLGASVMAREAITIFQATPSRLQLFIQAPELGRHLRRLNYLLVGGEVFPEALLAKLKQLTDGSIYNVYGPTETTIWSTIKEVSGRNILNIGKPLVNTFIYMLNRGGLPQPVGVAGEICISGEGVARGYNNRQELTKEKFSSNPFVKGERLYYTGDIGRWLPDGDIECLGRIDHQVKLRGFRIELGEIENLLRKHDRIKDAVTVVTGDETGDRNLTAYFVSAEEIPGAELREYLSKNLPYYMLPSFFVHLEKIPLTSNGKIDRRALPEPELSSKNRYAPPRSSIEETLVEIWRAVLFGIGKDAVLPVIGIDNNFFELGGHSLNATVMISKIHKELNVEVPLSVVFKTPTIRGLSEYIKGAGAVKYAAVEPAEKKDYYVLSSAQKRLYILQHMELKSTAYNMPGIISFPRELNAGKLAVLFKKLVHRHEGLRTSFHMINEEPVQVIQDEVEFEIEYYESGDLPSASVNSAGAAKNFVRPFDLSEAPLMRVGMLSLESSKTVFILDIHHIVMDGISQEILIKDFISLYGGNDLPGLNIQYKDFSEWQNREKDNTGIKKQEEYWIKEFNDDVPILDIPTDFLRPPVQHFEGSAIGFELNSYQTASLKKLAIEKDATLFIVLFAIYSIFLSKISGQEDIVVGTPIAGRRHPDLQGIIGMFVNTLAIRNYPDAKKRITEFLGQVIERVLDTFENQEYPFEDLVERLVNVTRSAGRNPVFDTMFALQNIERSEFDFRGLELKPYDPGSKESKFDLTLLVIETEGHLSLTFEYAARLFREETINRFITYYKNVISQVIEDPNREISEIEIISLKEKEQILFFFNDTHADYPQEKTIQWLFEEQVERTPDHIAVVGKAQGAAVRFNEPLNLGNISITYRELNKKSNRLAGIFKEKGVGPGTLVGLMVDRTLHMIIGLYGILKAGGSYLPVAPDYPPERVRYMLEDSGSSLLLTTEKYTGTVSIEGEVLSVEDESLYRHADGSNPGCDSGPEDLVYVIYTSGSTGRPKGVPIKIGAFVNLVNWYITEFGINAGDKFLLIAPIGFDLAQKNLFAPLAVGGCLCLPSAGLLDYDELSRFVALERQTVINCAPTVFYPFIEFNRDESFKMLKSLRYVFLGGEPIRMEKLHPWLDSGNCGCEIVNTYGPTECTDVVSYYRVPGDKEKQPGVIPIGKPIDNVVLFVLDKRWRLQPVGIYGEVCIGGIGLSRGYLNNPGLTGEKFISIPYLSPSPGICYYRTGDLGRWLPDGNIEFLGRIDQQVKIRGLRIELSEIEVQLLKHKRIKEAVVAVTGDEDAAQGLAAYFVSEIELSDTELRDYLSSGLPYYMIPAYFMRLEEIPLTPSGKIDRKALPSPGPKAFEGFVAPGNRTEEVLAGIWSGLLGIEKKQIGTYDNFFQLGGHSLNATIVVSRICKTFGIELSLGEFFRRPTIKELGNFLKTLNKSIYDTVIPVEKRWYYPQSSAQKRLFFLDHFENIGTSYNMYAVLKIMGKPDEKQFEKTFETLIARHEALRTSFHIINEEPVQRVHDTVGFEIEYYKYEKTKKIEEIVESFVRPFELAKAPLLRAGVCSLPGNEFLLFFDIHHIVSDGTSMSIMIDEFTCLYADEKLSPLTLQYKDFSCWQNNLFLSGKIKRQEEYWLNIYPNPGEIPRLNLPTDYPRPAVMSFEGAHYKFEPVRSDLLRLEKLGTRHGATLYMSLLSVFYILLYKYTGQNDIVVGSGIMGRRHDSLLNIIGMFVNVLANRNKPDGSKSCLDFLKEVKENSIQAFENQDVQFESLVDMLQIQRDTSRNPLFDVTFVVQNFKRSRLELKDRTFILGDYDNRSSKFDITLFANQTGDEGNEISFTLEYSTVLFKQATVERFVAHFLNAIARVGNNPDLHLDDIDILSEEEKHMLLHQFNRTCDFTPPQETVHRLYEERAAKNPDKTALIFGDRFLTYKQLDEKSNQIANLLCSVADAGTGRSIGILMDRSPELIAAMLGILKAGCSYVPINPLFPEKRVKGILTDAAVEVLISQKQYVRLVNRLLWECTLLSAAICLDSRAIYSEKEEEKSGLMDNELWDYVAESAEDEITLGGWNTSYTGEPFSKREMEEYSDNILKKLLPYLHQKMRVLEVGCGSGFSMYPIASRVGFYYGTDLSKKIIDKNRERVKEENLENIALACIPAHEIDTIEEGNFDLIVINSVIQSFHGHNYFRKVIKKALEKLGKKGFMFIGDVMDLELKDALTKEMIEFKRTTVNENYKTKTDFSSELFLSREFFEDLAVEFPEISDVEFSEKIHTIENELTKFRYDAFITVDKHVWDRVEDGGKHKPKHKYLYDLTQLETCGTGNVPVQVEPDHLAYLLYTSGSTGSPKGVMIEHRNVVSLVNNPAFIDLRETDRLLLTGSIAFDITTFEIWSPLLNGLNLVLIEEDVLLDSERLENTIVKSAISILHLIPQLFGQLATHRPGMFAGLKYFLVGGDLVQPKYVNMIRERYENLKILHMYGPTENTTFSTVFPVLREYKINIPIGKPIGNSTVYILNKKDKLQPLGVFGELCVSGEGIARGYLNDPGLTDRKFAPDPFVAGKKIYKTGDLGRWTLEGNIEFAGRMDRQVKIRGIRIELQEIELRLLERDDIKETLVMAKEDSSGEFFLCAYIVPRKDKLEISGLREYLSKELPEFMVPSYFILLERFPTTSNGKIDKKRLPDPGTVLENKEIEELRNELEVELAGIWSGVLGIEERLIGIDTNFFEIGGHSLKATVLISKIHKELNIKIPIAEIFKRPTIRGLTGYIKEAVECTFLEIEPVEKREYYALSSAQKSIYIVQQMDLGSTAYNTPVILGLEGKIEKEKLENTFLELINRHESLRTSFELVGDEPVQWVHHKVDFECEYFDLIAENPGVKGQSEEIMIEEITKAYIRPFDLSHAPLLRVILLKKKEQKHILMVDIHHIISDETSIIILINDFKAIHEGQKLLPIKIQYKDFSEWQNSAKRGNTIKRQEEYWLKQFEEKIPGLNLPIDYDRTRVLDFEGASIYFEIDGEMKQALTKFALEKGATLFMVLLAVWNILLGKICGQEDVVVGTPIEGRRYNDLNQVMGMFVNMLVLRNYPRGEKIFKELVEDVKIRTIEAFENQDYQFDDMVNKIDPAREVGRMPLVDVLLQLQNRDRVELELDLPGVKIKLYEFRFNISKFDMNLNVVEKEETLEFKFRYKTKLFNENSIKKLIESFILIISQVISNPEIKISEIQLIREEEENQFVKKTSDDTGGKIKIRNRTEEILADFDI